MTSEKAQQLPISTSTPPPTRSPLKTALLLALALISFAFVSPVSVLSLTSLRSAHPTGLPSIDWYPCPPPTADRFSCATYAVPKDHSGVEEGQVRLALRRYEAEKGRKRLGTLFINPGGPGGSGFDQVSRSGPSISIITGGQWDVVGWDPRGVGASEPAYRCFDSAFEEDLFTASLPAPPSLPHNVSAFPSVFADYEAQFKAQLPYVRLYNKICQEKNKNGIGRFLTSHAVVRDLEMMSRAAWKKGDVNERVNYWGFSYGTIIGAQLTGIFPDKIGRVALDGLSNARLWQGSPRSEGDVERLQDIDKVLQGFAAECVKAGPDRCALSASPNQTAEALLQSIGSLLDRTYASPLLVPDAPLFPTVLRAEAIVMYIYLGMYKPRNWPALASALRDALAGDGKAIIGPQQPPNSDPKALASSLFSNTAISCSDSLPRVNDTQSNAELAAIGTERVKFEVEKLTSWFASVGTGRDDCVGWTTVEGGYGRYNGSLSKPLSNSILLLGTTADPTCPVSNAYEMNAYQPQSRVVHQDSFGHCSSSLASLCTLTHIRTYFGNGTLPNANVFCGVDEEYFPIPAAVDGSTDTSRRWSEKGHETDERELLEAGRRLGEAMGQFV